jgi:hypothetical protein
MQVSESQWSALEKETAQEAFQRAYEREVLTLIQDVRNQIGSLSKIDDLWRLHDFLSAKRHELDGKYEYDYPSLLFVFANLIRDGWLQLDELETLEKEKLSKIAALVRL